MAVPIRGTKASAGGGTAFVANTDILAAEVNTDFDNLYTQMSNIEDANVAAGANIDPQKIGDTSASATSHAAADYPGNSASHVLPVHLSDELEQLRYAIEVLGLGIDAIRVDGSGTGTTFWGDLPARGANLIQNPHFVAQQAGAGAAPDLWTLEGTPATCALTAKAAADGDGPALRIVADAGNEGVSQTIDGLKSATTYLVVAAVNPDVGTCSLRVTGADAASSFRNATATSVGLTRQVLKCVVQTDATPTSLKIEVESNANLDDFQIQFVGVYECSTNHGLTKGGMIVHDSDSSNATNYTTAGFTAVPGIGITIYVPGPGYAIRVNGVISGTSSGGAAGLVVRLNEDVNGAGAATVRVGLGTQNGGNNQPVSAAFDFVRTNPTPGVTYAYTLDARGVNQTVVSNGTHGTVASETTLTVELVRVG